MVSVGGRGEEREPREDEERDGKRQQCPGERGGRKQRKRRRDLTIVRACRKVPPSICLDDEWMFRDLKTNLFASFNLAECGTPGMAACGGGRRTGSGGREGEKQKDGGREGKHMEAGRGKKEGEVLSQREGGGPTTAGGRPPPLALVRPYDNDVAAVYIRVRRRRRRKRKKNNMERRRPPSSLPRPHLTVSHMGAPPPPPTSIHNGGGR